MATKEQFILLVIHIAMANSFALINIRNMNEDELIDKLVKVLDSGKGARTVLKNHVDVRRSRKDLHDAHIKFERLRRIKNRNPYGPHDVNLQTEDEPIYKMLKRLHKKKPIFIKVNNEHRIQNVGRTGSFSYPKHDSELHGNNTRWQLLPSNNRWGNPPNSNDQSTGSKNDVPNDWQQLNPSKPSWKQWAGLDRNKTSDNFTKFWQKLKNLKNKFFEKGKRNDKSHLKSLRQENGNKRSKSKLRSRSGEEHDPLAPGKVPYNNEHDATTVKTNKWLPSYPYWNYWTYNKSLYQDDCEGDTIKVGALCIRPPPH